MSQVIERALKHVSKSTSSEAELNEELTRLNHLRENLLPVEREARQRVEEEIRTLTTRRSSLQHDLPVLDPVVLGWRQKEILRVGFFGAKIPLPSLAVISVNASPPEMKIAERDVTIGGADHREANLAYYYQDVTSVLEAEGRRKAITLAIRSAYSGMIPDATKAKIRERRQEFDTIALISEAKWTLEKTPLPVMVDPLVVGISGGSFYLIDVFDPTSVEDYIAKEFAR